MSGDILTIVVEGDIIISELIYVVSPIHLIITYWFINNLYFYNHQNLRYHRSSKGQWTV